ncbi:MAG: symmetrical bis(5'-nucleosyl)-tetraphosphatase [Nitrospira sp.]|nr:symmetrical bis(5'-nucleosyl)-tetraphosphatase [Nitrospira sp.]MBH0186465.1 symmetrical bis(5'-nucleosyl)-tetraphosphatase [Nitrospira sp.]
MATYAIGDIQGCLTSLRHLLDRISFQPHTDRIWLVGDLVNRGPDSLTTLRFLKSLGAAAHPILGNHDLFLLAAAEGIVSLRPKDTIQDILAADDRADLIEWLRHIPLHHREGAFLMVHAGLLPQWTVDDATQHAQEIETILSGAGYRTFLQQLFHGPTTPWSPSLNGMERLTSIARVLTRIRTCTRSGELSSFSGPPEYAPPGCMPWFHLPNRRNADVTIITGHWAALGLRLEVNHLAIDSGCVWGRQLTAVRLEDRAVFQVNYADRRS